MGYFGVAGSRCGGFRAAGRVAAGGTTRSRSRAGAEGRSGGDSRMHRLLPGDSWGPVVAERCGSRGMVRFCAAHFLRSGTGQPGPMARGVRR